MASAQDLLSATGDEGSDLRTLVDAVVKPLSPDASRLEVIGPQVLLPVEATMPFAMILHELATNALKLRRVGFDAGPYGDPVGAFRRNDNWSSDGMRKLPPSRSRLPH